LQVNRLVQKQAETVEAERTALMAQQHKDLEKLIAAISASVNRDLPLRIEEMVRRELAGLAGSVAASVAASVRTVVAPACQSALAEALPRDLAGPQLQVCSPPSPLTMPCFVMRMFCCAIYVFCSASILQFDKFGSKSCTQSFLS